MSSRLKAHLALIGANIIYGLNYSIAKVSLPDYIAPYGYIFLRVATAGLIYFLLSRLFIRERVARSDFPRLILCGIFGVAINQTMFFKGLSITTEINAALIMITTPVLVMFLSHFILKESITARKLAGIITGSAGAGFLILFGKDFEPGSDTLLGDLFIFINAFSYGLYLVLVKPLMRKYHPLTIIMWVFLFGFLFTGPNGYKQLTEVDWSSFTWGIWLSVLYVLLATTVLAYLLNVYALSRVNPSVVSVYIYSQPLIATLVSSSIGNDHLTATKLLAGMLIFAGVYLVSGWGTRQANGS